MTLQPTPPISLNDIKAEFGATGSRGLTEFYRGGAFVPNSPVNAGIPTSGAIDLLDFLGASSISVALSNHTVQGYEQSEANPSPPPTLLWNAGDASFAIRSDGVAHGGGSTGDSGTGTNTDYPGEWLVSGTASDFEVRATVTSGTLSSGTTGTWLNCGTTRTWQLVYALSGTSTAAILVEIRPVGGSVMASATITLSVTR